jgi:hypothetical protein
MAHYTNRKIQTSELDFDAIKANIKSYLEGQDTFKDYDFEGSSMSILLDILAYNTHYNALYTNLAVNESFLDSASKRSSVVSRAKEIGYIPHSATGAVAKVNVVVSNTTSTPASLTIPANQPFSSTINGSTYNFYNTEAAVAVLDGSTYTFADVEIKEGTPLQFKYTVADGTRYLIPNQDVDLSTVKVRVQENAQSGTFETFVRQDELLDLNETSKVFFVKEIEGQLYELEFGNDVIGKGLANGNVVTISYMTTNKTEANGARVFSYQGATLLGGNTAVTTTLGATGGTDVEDIESIRYNAPRYYTAQNRAVTTEDYKATIYRAYPDAQTINVWGGEDNIPAQYGKVFISIKPETTNALTAAQKDLIITEILKNKNVVSITPEIVDPEYINLEITTSVYYNPNLTTRALSDIKDLVIQTIKDYNNDHLESFTGIFKYSNLSRNIDDTEDSILSNITTIKLHREVEVRYNSNTTYEINLGNPIYHSGVPEQSVSTHGFMIAGYDQMMYIEDFPNPDDQTGYLRLYYIENDIKNYIRDFGEIDYDTGYIKMNEIEITGIDTSASPSFEFIIKPQSNDVASIRNQLVQIPDNNIFVNVIADKVAQGDQAGNSNYVFTSSRN